MDEYLRITGVSYENSMDFECFSNNLEGDAPGSPRMHHLYLLYNLAVRGGDCHLALGCLVRGRESYMFIFVIILCHRISYAITVYPLS